MKKDNVKNKLEDSIFSLELMTNYPGEFSLPPSKESQELPKGNMMLMSEKEGGVAPFIKSISTPGKFIKKRVDDLLTKESRILKGDTIIDDTHYDPCTGNGRDSRSEAELSGALSALLEDQQYNNHRLIFLSHDTVNLFGRGWFSVPIARVPTYRVSTFSSVSLINQLAKIKIMTANLETCAQIIFDNFGGQFNLTSHFLKSVQHNLPEETLKNNLSKYRNQIESNPPSYVFRWLDQLKMLLIDPEMKELLAAYVGGGFKDENQIFTNQEVQLYLAGWLHNFGEKGIGIRSSFHNTLAARALREVSK